MGMELKFISYNIRHGWKLDKVIEFLSQQKADVVQLQEVATQGLDMQVKDDFNMFEVIGKKLGMEGKFGRMFWIESEQGKWDLGNATYSRFPIQTFETHVYDAPVVGTFSGSIKERKFEVSHSLLNMVVEVEGKQLRLINGHASVTADGKEAEFQTGAVRKMKEYLNQFDEYILSGDMNMTPQFKIYSELSEGLRDITDHNKPTLHPTDHVVGEMGYHVDYVFLKGEVLQPIEVEVLVVEGSDHLPVVCKLGIEA